MRYHHSEPPGESRDEAAEGAGRYSGLKLFDGRELPLALEGRWWTDGGHDSPAATHGHGLSRQAHSTREATQAQRNHGAIAGSHYNCGVKGPNAANEADDLFVNDVVGCAREHASSETAKPLLTANLEHGAHELIDP